MNPTDVAQIVESLGALAKILDSLGLAGFVALWLSIPVILSLAMLGVEFWRSRKSQEIIADMRQENTELANSFRAEAQVWRAESRETLEVYRGDTQKALRELGAHQREIAQYYKDNVELVKVTQRLAENLQDVILNNTRVSERVATMMEGWRRP